MGFARALGRACVAALLTLFVRPSAAAPPDALAPPPPPVSAADPAPAAAAPDAKAKAIDHFKKGLSLSDANAHAAALAEFLEARRLYPLRNATFQAGICLEKLQRFDEALDMFEALLREFGESMPAEVKPIAQRKVIEMRALVGTIEVEGAEPGSAIVIDGRERGEFPALAPLRVAAGSHLVRVFKEGLEPFEKRVEVAGGQLARVRANLRVLTSGGRLRVIEQSGKSLSVEIDGNVVGKTPWEGRLAMGEHVVLLRGDNDIGTPPISVTVELNKSTPLTLLAEELAARLRVEPVPVNASVAIDAVVVGRGVWEGRLREGRHTVEIASPGFLPSILRVDLSRGEREVIQAPLGRDETSLFWRKPPRRSRRVVELTVAAATGPTTFGGDVAETCVRSCLRTIPLGGTGLLRAGYELGSGLGFGAMVGYLALVQSTARRAASVNPIDLASPPALPSGAGAGLSDDRLAFRGGIAGAWLGFTWFETFPLHLRLGAGAVLGDILNERRGRFQASTGRYYNIGSVAERHDAHFLYLEPELRWGFRIQRHVEVNVGLGVPVLVSLGQPRWDAPQTHYVRAGDDGLGTFTADALMSSTLVAFTPGVGARYDF